MISEDKNYFFDMVATVREKLNHRPEGSLIRKCFSNIRLEEIDRRIADSDAKNLERAYWQPFFLFLKDASEAAINSLDDDLQTVLDRSPQEDAQVCRFLKDESESDSRWMGGLFEVFAKVALLKSDLLSVDAIDQTQSNGKDIDAKVTIGQRTIGVEMTTLGESDESKRRWRNHCEALEEDPSASFYDRQDAYTQGRRLFDKVYEKIAPGFDATRSQLLPNASNLLLIGLSPLISDLTPRSSSIGWALDELFSSQPSGNKSQVSLAAYLQHKLNGKSGLLQEMLAAPRQVSGILLFHGCTLGHARINYNAAHQSRISHSEMAIVERILAQPPAYCE